MKAKIPTHKVVSDQGFEGAFASKKEAAAYARELVEKLGVQAVVQPY